MDQLPRLGKRELICLLLFTCNYVDSVWRGFLFLWVLGMGYLILLWHSLSLPYNYLRREIKADIRKQHDLYVNNLVGDVRANLKDFYRYINSQKKDAQDIPPLKKRNGCGVAQSESEKAAEFNGQFTNVFTKSEYSQVPLLDRSAPFMEDIVVTKEGVTKLLKGLNPSKALGPDELHPRVLKELATELGPIFVHLFQHSIDSGDIPKEWTLANISPLFKKGDRLLACNYRPVSLTCVPCTLLEHIVCSNIMAHLDEHKLLSDKQHAFRKWHSCETQLATVINDWAKILDNKDQVDTFILDFEKDFDTPTHMNSLRVNCLVMELVVKH